MVTHQTDMKAPGRKEHNVCSKKVLGSSEMFQIHPVTALIRKRQLHTQNESQLQTPRRSIEVVGSSERSESVPKPLPSGKEI